ncbi:MAG: abortive infection family protein [Magnetococcales bacterium]|nr:hypothetical protein [Magnetococcales bacterium]NGZ26013.1 abortive infection family protein [Magnetococcales bacterium]
MSIFDLFSKRLKREKGQLPDIYDYNSLPRELRVQIIHIISDAFGDAQNDIYCRAYKTYDDINRILCREFGVFHLLGKENRPDTSIFNFFLSEESIERSLDVVEVCFNKIYYFAINNAQAHFPRRRLDPLDAIHQLNYRFKEHAVGYQFESGQIVRIDSEFIHAEAVKPVLAVLRDSKFKGANEEFLKAHEHYRHRRFKESVVEALKAFESTMKTVCHLRGWKYDSEAPAKKLFITCRNNGLFPAYLESQFNHLIGALENGIPTIRNKNGAHGQGMDPIPVPEYLVRYALNLTASTILFIMEAHNNTK